MQSSTLYNAADSMRAPFGDENGALARCARTRPTGLVLVDEFTFVPDDGQIEEDPVERTRAGWNEGEEGEEEGEEEVEVVEEEEELDA